MGKVIWSDESSFTHFSSTSGLLLEKSNDVFNPPTLLPAVSHGVGSLIAWTAILHESLCFTIASNGCATAKEYEAIFQDHVLQTVDPQDWN